ncbi:MAG: hypothetical protein ACP5ON_11615 [Bacteroidota bacterium]
MGKASLIMIIGFSVIFGLFRINFSRDVYDASKNFTRYFSREAVHHIAISGAEIALGKLAETNGSFSGATVPTMHGVADITVTDYIAGEKAYKKVVSVASYSGESDTVTVLMWRQPFSKWASFVEGVTAYYAYPDTIDENLYWHGGQLRTKGHVVFKGYVSLSQAPRIEKGDPGGNSVAEFQDSVGIDEDIPIPQTNNIALAANSGFKVTDKDLWLNFQPDGTVQYKVTGGTWQTASVSTLAPNGVFAALNGHDVHVWGTVVNHVTIFAQKQGSSGGRIWVDDDLLVGPPDARASDIKDRPGMIGLVADRDVIVTDNLANSNDCIIHAGIFAASGTFYAENYAGRGLSGTLHVIGSIVHEGYTGRMNQYGQLVSGFHELLEWDRRFGYDFPPYYPNTDRLEIISWRE